MNILIIEQDNAFAEWLKAIGEENGHNVEVCSSWKDVQQIIVNRELALILANVFIQDFDGRQLILDLKTMCPEAKIIAVTDHNTREQELAIRKQDILYYMIRPVDKKYITSLLNHLEQKDIVKGMHC
jgi:DNA-binding NtrC family response regulator